MSANVDTARGIAELTEHSTRTSQEEDGGSHIRVLAGTTSRVLHSRLDNALVVLVGCASGHLQSVSTRSPTAKSVYIPHLGKHLAQLC
jgi:hypothetical protein